MHPTPTNAPQIQDAVARVAEARRVADVPALRVRLKSKENDALADGVWDDAAAGQALMAEISDLKSELQEIEGCVCRRSPRICQLLFQRLRFRGHRIK